MGIIDRAQAVLASNFNALITRFEEPGRDIALLLTEMKEQIRAAERELIRMVGESKRNESKLAEVEAEVAVWERRAELAVRKGDDELARAALAHKQRLLGDSERLRVNRAEQHHAAVTMKLEIDRMKRTHQDYTARQHTIAVAVSHARAGGGATQLGAKPGANSFEAFEAIENDIASSEAEVAAHAELDQMLNQTSLGTMSRSELDERFQQLEGAASSSELEERIRQFKGTAEPAEPAEPSSPATIEETPAGARIRIEQ